MTTKKLPGQKTAVTPTGIKEVVDGLKTIATCVRDVEKERTEQARIRETSRLEVERIHAMRDVLLEYLQRSFDERETNFRQLFERLDSAIDAKDPQLAAVVLDSVVKLADSSPFKALQDVAAARAALAEKKEWEF